MLRLLLVSSFLLFLINCNISTTEWTDPVSGTKYDYSALKRNPE